MTSPIRPRILCCWPLAVAIGLAGLLAQGSCALAQTATRATLPGDPTLPGVPSRVRPEGPFPDDSETAPDLPAAIPSDDPTRDPEDGDPLEVRPAAGQRPAIRDGDLSYPAEPRAPVDGLIDPREPEPVLDGVDPLTIDTRPREDIDAFENPPAGYDPLLFQIEDIDPLSDRRTRRLAKLEPYDPVGIRIGSFVLFPEVEAGGSWYSNVLRSPAPVSDVALDFKPSARLVSDWGRHALEFRAASTLSFYNDLDSEDDRAYTLEARGRLDFTRRTNLQAFAVRDVSQESRSAIDANAAGDRATLTQHRAGGAFQHRFNRLTLQLRGSVTDYDYSDIDVNGVTQSNRERNHTDTEEAVRATWEFKPSLYGFAEVGANQRRYEAVASSDGISRDSDGERYRVGVGFGQTGQILRGEVSVGYGRQTPVDSRLSSIEGIIVDANLAWRVSELTTVLLTARSDITETTSAQSGGVQTQSAGVEVRHAFLRHLIGSAGLTYSTNNYSGIDLNESELRGDLGVEYFLSREAILFGRYRHTKFDSPSPGASYNADEVHVGMRLRR